jgi:DtxR family Mn-dependent transcriptional regulator
MPSSTVENYLKAILHLSAGSEELVAMGDLATALAVVPGTATTMAKGLAADGLIVHQPRAGVKLTAAGRKIALGVLRRHRIIETFLVEVLKMGWADVHAEAERLEHAISDEVLDRLDALLGHPAADPHGDPIPSRGGLLPSPVHATLATCPVEKALRIVRVTEQTASFLNFAENHGLRPGAKIEVVHRDLTAGTVSFHIAGRRPGALSLAAAGNILVERVR